MLLMVANGISGVICHAIYRFVKANNIISIHSLNQKVLDYPQKYASILHGKRLYQAHLANSTGRDYLVPVQFNLVKTYFYSRESLLPVFLDLHVVPQSDKDICVNQVVRFLLDMFCLVEQCLV